MKYILIFITVLFIGVIVFWFEKPSLVTEQPVLDTEVDTEVFYDTYTDTTAGLMFEYRTAPDKYIVEDLTSLIAEEDNEVVKVLRLISEREKIEMEHGPGRGGPATINIMLFNNPHGLSASQWINITPLFSNVDFVMGSINSDATVSGENAVRYTTDGMFMSDNVVVSHGAYIYHFVGSYADIDSSIHKDFKHLIDTVTFIPTDTTAPSGPLRKES